MPAYAYNLEEVAFEHTTAKSKHAQTHKIQKSSVVKPVAEVERVD